jgi:regulator of sigma D
VLEECKDVNEYWQGVDQLIKRWLDERETLLDTYDNVSDIIVNNLDDAQAIPRLRTFCQILMDYISAGHFEIYGQLVKEGKVFADKKNASLADELYPRIIKTTDDAVAFNDTYDTDQHCHVALSKLPTALAHLGMSLKERFALEDKLIQSLHRSHRNLIG